MTAWTTASLESRTINLDRRRVPITGKDRVPGPFPYYGASGVVDHVDSFIFDGLHLLVAEDGENLRSRKTPIAFLADGKFWVNNHAHVLQANEDNDIRFLSYALEATDLSAYITGSTQPKLSQGSLNRIPIFAPGLGEQRQIAATLGALDAKVDSNIKAVRATMDLVDAMAVKEGEDLPQVPMTYLATIARDSVNPSSLGAQLVDHFSLPAFDESGAPEISSASTIMSGKLLIRDRAVLVSKLNPRFNRTWWVRARPTVPAMASTEFLVLTAGSPLGLSAVWLAARDPHFMSELRRRVTGTSGSHQRVRPDDALSIMVPDFSQASEEVLRAVLALLDRSSQMRAENRRLIDLRDTLGSELLSGRLDLAEIQGVTA